MADKPEIHEDFDRGNEVKAGSEKAFGLVFAVVFTVIGLWPVIDGSDVRVWALVAAGLFGLAALAMPKILSPLNRLWFRFGLLLHHIVNPVVMALLFFTTVTPMALIMRLLGKDPLRRKFDPEADSYWIPRQPAGPAPETMKNQF
jgi:predicted membrane metal-binding protein